MVSYNRLRPLIWRQAHVVVNRGAKRREAGAAQRRRLRPRLGRQHAAGDAAGRDAVGEVVLRAELCHKTDKQTVISSIPLNFFLFIFLRDKKGNDERMLMWCGRREFSAYTLNAALRPRKDGTHDSEIARAAVARARHVAHAAPELFAHGQAGDFGAGGGEGGVVAHLEGSKLIIYPSESREKCNNEGEEEGGSVDYFKEKGRYVEGKKSNIRST